MSEIDGWFYSSLPQKWRKILGALTAIGLAFYVFIGFCAFYFDDFKLTAYVFIGLIIVFTVHLVRDAVVSGVQELEQHPAYQSKMGYWSTAVFGFLMLFFSISIFAGEYEKSREELKQVWIISEFCSENGEYRPDRARECLLLKSSVRKGLCALGAEPMNDCERNLRIQLNRPIE